MNSLLMKCSFSSISRRYWNQKGVLALKELESFSQPLDLQKESLSTKELTVMICQQLNPSHLVKIFNKYSEIYTEKHILQSLKITAKMLGQFNLPIYDHSFLIGFKNMIKQFNTYIPQLNNLDLADYLYWYKKFSTDGIGQQFLENVDQSTLQQTIKINIQKNNFLARQLNMVYECIDLVFTDNKELSSQFMDNLFITNDISSPQLIQFVSSIHKKFVYRKKMDIKGVVEVLQYQKKIVSSFDVDQIAILIRTFSALKLNYYLQKKEELQAFFDIFKLVENQLNFLESSPILNILLAQKYLPKDYHSPIFMNIHNLVMKAARYNIDLDFLLGYIIRSVELPYVDQSDIAFLLDIATEKLNKEINNEAIYILSQYLLQTKNKEIKFINLTKLYLQQLSLNNINELYLLLVYLHHICKQNISEYLTNLFNLFLQNYGPEYERRISKLCLIYLQSLYDIYPNIKQPVEIQHCLNKVNYTQQILNLSQCIYKSNKQDNIFINKLLNIRIETTLTDRNLKFWQTFLNFIKTDSIAERQAQWIYGHNKEFVNQILPYLFATNDGIDITRVQAYFFYQLFKLSLNNLNLEILFNGLVYSEKLLEQLLMIDSKIIQNIFDIGYKYNYGFGIAQLILLLNDKATAQQLKSFNFQQILLQSYKQLEKYHVQLILLMAKYKCLPIKDSLKLFNNIVGEDVELRIFIFYLALSQKIGLEHVISHIQKQLLVLNETYVIQIQ